MSKLSVLWLCISIVKLCWCMEAFIWDRSEPIRVPFTCYVFNTMHREPISSNLVSATSDPFWFSHFSAVSSSLFQGFKSLQLRLIGPGLVGFGLLLTVVWLLLRNMTVVLVNVNPSSILSSMTIHQVRVLLCTLPPYINGCRWPIVPLFRCSLLIAKSNDISRSEISRESYALPRAMRIYLGVKL